MWGHWGRRGICMQTFYFFPLGFQLFLKALSVSHPTFIPIGSMMTIGPILEEKQVQLSQGHRLSFIDGSLWFLDSCFHRLWDHLQFAQPRPQVPWRPLGHQGSCSALCAALSECPQCRWQLLCGLSGETGSKLRSTFPGCTILFKIHPYLVFTSVVSSSSLGLLIC